MTQGTYRSFCRSLDKELEHYGITHFFARELAREDRPPYPGVALWENIYPTLLRMEWLRAVMGEGPIRVTSCWRNPEHNAEVGGGPRSLHLSFNAVDFQPLGLEGEERRAWLEEAYRRLDARRDSSTFGLARYDSFIHLDTRGLLGRWAPARW